MQSEALKLAKFQSQAVLQAKAIDLGKTIVTNPAFELIMSAYILIQMRKHHVFEGFTGSLEEAALMTAIAGCVGLQQIAPLMPYIAQGAESLGKAIPGMLALGAAAL